MVFPHREGCKPNDGVDAHFKEAFLLRAGFTFSRLAMYIWEKYHTVLTVSIAKIFQGRNQLVNLWMPVFHQSLVMKSQSLEEVNICFQQH